MGYAHDLHGIGLHDGDHGTDFARKASGTALWILRNYSCPVLRKSGAKTVRSSKKIENDGTDAHAVVFDNFGGFLMRSAGTSWLLGGTAMMTLMGSLGACTSRNS